MRLCLVGLLLAVPLGAGSAVAAAAPRVSFELVTEDGFSLTGNQEWMTLVKGMVDGVRIRSSEKGDQPEVTNIGTDEAPNYRVVGVLTAQGRLFLPGGKFTLGDRAKLAAWINKLRQDGAESLTAETGPFGLTAKELLAVHESLKTPLAFSTKDQPTFEVASNIARKLSIQFAIDEGAQKILEGEELVADELQGLSSGTALAALLRPLGLSLVPEKPSGEPVQLAILEYRDAKESWPVGWPPKAAPGKAFPKLFAKFQVGFNQAELEKVLVAVKQRLEIPLLYDHNSIARHRIDIPKARVNIPAQRTYYLDVLQKSLGQAKLKSELRVDEADQPFVWISTMAR